MPKRKKLQKRFEDIEDVFEFFHDEMVENPNPAFIDAILFLCEEIETLYERISDLSDEIRGYNI